MLRIRLRRVGKKGKPSYRIVVAEAKAPRDGAYVEWIGNYDPMVDPPAVSLKTDRAVEWLRQGAQPSDAVRRILDWNGILERTPLRGADREPVADQAAAEVSPGVALEEVAAQPTTGEAPPGETAAEAVPDEITGEAPAEETAPEAVQDEITGEAPADETTGEAPQNERAD